MYIGMRLLSIFVKKSEFAFKQQNRFNVLVHPISKPKIQQPLFQLHYLHNTVGKPTTTRSTSN